MPRGHAFEFRINAEDVGRGFLPTPGPVRVFEPPSGPGVRVDTGVLSGSTVPGTFDSLMAKLIVTGATRAQAIARARRALKEFRIEGVASVLPFHRAVMEHADFTSDDAFKVHTRWIETDFANTLAAAVRSEPPVSDAALVRTAIEIDGRRMALGCRRRTAARLAVGWRCRGGAVPARAGCGRRGIGSGGPGIGRRVRSPATLQSWKVADGDERGPGGHRRDDGGHEDGDAGDRAPGRAHRAEGGGGRGGGGGGGDCGDRVAGDRLIESSRRGRSTRHAIWRRRSTGRSTLGVKALILSLRYQSVAGPPVGSKPPVTMWKRWQPSLRRPRT